MEPFTAKVDEPVLDALRERVRGTRWPEQFDDPTWSQGVDASFLRELCGYWSDHYDWRVDEARLNSFDQWTATVHGQTLHFIHRRSSNPDATPLLILHGWPCSIFGGHRRSRRSFAWWAGVPRGLPLTARIRILDAGCLQGH